MSDKKGYTLIEVLLSILVIGALALGGVSSLQHVGRSVQKQQQSRTAVTVASSVLEYNIYEVGLESLKAQTEAAGGMLSVSAYNKTLDDGMVFSIAEEYTYDSDSKLWLRVSVSGQSSDPVTLCYVAWMES